MSVFKGNFAELKAVSWGMASPGPCSLWTPCVCFNLEAGFGRTSWVCGSQSTSPEDNSKLGLPSPLHRRCEPRGVHVPMGFVSPWVSCPLVLSSSVTSAERRALEKADLADVSDELKVFEMALA